MHSSNKLASIFMFLCLAMCGCKSSPYTATKEEPYEEWTDWTDGQLVSIVNDSLAILKIHKYQKNTWYEIGFESDREEYEIIDARTGLFLVNYRVKQKPLWGDTLNYDLRVTGDYYKDSSVLVFDRKNNQFGFWKIGTNSIEFKKYKNDSRDCRFYKDYYEYYYYPLPFEARPWINGNILLKSENEDEDECLLSILNTSTGQIESFEFSGEYEWLYGCLDFSYIENKIVCARKNDTTEILELVVNGAVTDTSRWWYNVSNWYGNYIKEGNGNLTTGEAIKIDTKSFKFDKTLTPIWFKNSRINSSKYTYELYSAFQENSGDFNSDTFIMYYSKDLI